IGCGCRGRRERVDGTGGVRARRRHAVAYRNPARRPGGGCVDTLFVVKPFERVGRALSATQASCVHEFSIADNVRPTRLQGQLQGACRYALCLVVIDGVLVVVLSERLLLSFCSIVLSSGGPVCGVGTGVAVTACAAWSHAFCDFSSTQLLERSKRGMSRFCKAVPVSASRFPRMRPCWRPTPIGPSAHGSSRAVFPRRAS